MTLEDIDRRLRAIEDIEEIKSLKPVIALTVTIITTLTASLAFSLKMRSGMVGFGARLKEGMRFVTSSFGLPRGFPSRCIW